MKENKLREIDKEDIIWLIFIALFILKLYSNVVERDYRINNNQNSRKLYHNINTFTFIGALLITIYYIYNNLKDENRNNVFLITNIVSGIIVVIFIYYEITDKD